MSNINKRSSGILHWIPTFTVLLIAAFIAALPLLWALSTSLKPEADVYRYPPSVFPSKAVFEHYIREWSSGLPVNFVNSMVVSVSTVIISVVLGLLGGYAAARYRFRGKKILMFLILAMMAIPFLSNLIPTYLMMANLHLVNTLWALILIYVARSLPITIWILRSFIETIPDELDRAAQVDGLNPLQVIIKIIVPLSIPGIAAASVFVFVWAWNDFITALTMIKSTALRTMPLAIYFQLGDVQVDWGGLSAVSVLSTLPILILFAILQEAFISGLTAGSVKG